jgi:hypothetical protein
MPAIKADTLYAAPAGHDGTCFRDLRDGEYFRSAPMFLSVYWKAQDRGYSVTTSSLSLIMHPDQPVERCNRGGA